MIPTTPAPTTRHDVSGRYRGRGHGFEVELRIDVDGTRPTRCISADYHRVSDGETTYVGSMRVDEPVVTLTGAQMTIAGSAVFSFTTPCRRVQVTIPVVGAGPRARGANPTATLRHAGVGGAPAAAYECAFTSSAFRTVELEQACERGVDPVDAYDTGSLAAGGAARQLSPAAAFAEAGIEMRSAGPPTVVDTSKAGANATWSDAELQAAMAEHLSRVGNGPAWAIWLLHAASHDDERLGGVMFDLLGPQRQGCAVFYGRGVELTPDVARDRLFTCVHELGHGFNLPHCWQKSLTEPPLPSRPEARSWMNYPERFPGGPDAYWPDFDFTFDEPELVHLRHGFQADVIMGGNPFAGGTARDRRPAWDAGERGDPGLRLRLSAPHALVQDVPVTVGLELSATTRREYAVPAILGPRPGNVGIAIRKPDGTESVFEPLLYHCRASNEPVTLRAGGPSIHDQAFIHYGKRGFAFDTPGHYLVRARYAPPDGPVVVSNIESILVRPPVSRVDRHVCALLGGDEQVGMLMSLMGSDAPALKRGDARLEEVIERYPAHPVAMVGRLVRAANLARGFKRLTLDGDLRVRPPRLEEAADLVGDVISHRPVPTRPSAGPGYATPRAPSDQIRIRPDVNPSVAGFFQSRIREAAAAVPDNA